MHCSGQFFVLHMASGVSEQVQIVNSMGQMRATADVRGVAVKAGGSEGSMPAGHGHSKCFRNIWYAATGEGAGGCAPVQAHRWRPELKHKAAIQGVAPDACMLRQVYLERVDEDVLLCNHSMCVCLLVGITNERLPAESTHASCCPLVAGRKT